MRVKGKIVPFLLLFAAMLLVLAACGSGNESSQGQTKDNSKKSAQTMNQSKDKDKVTMDGDKKSGKDDGSSTDQDMNMDQDNDTDKAEKDNNKSEKTDSESQSSNDKSKTVEKSDNEASSNSGHVLNVTAHNFKFNKEKFVAQSGEITINFKIDQGTHGFALYKSDHSFDKIVNIVGEGTKKVTLDPGTYYIHCSVVCGVGHGDMDATLVVK